MSYIIKQCCYVLIKSTFYVQDITCGYDGGFCKGVMGMHRLQGVAFHKYRSCDLCNFIDIDSFAQILQFISSLVYSMHFY